jgi:putative transcriptional regulator
MRIGRAALAACCLAVAALGLAATEPGALPGTDPAPAAQSPAPPPGDLLIASAQIGDPRFHHAVVLLLRHDKGGAFGIVINRPLAEETIAKLLESTGDDGAGVEGSVRVFGGGPVQPELGFLLHSADYHRVETMAVDGKVAMTGSKDALRDIARHKGPQKYLFALGYTGWGPGQLEAEIARQDWFTTPEDPALVFDEDRGALWDKALARRSREL